MPTSPQLGFVQGFAANTDGFFTDGGYGAIERVPSGTNGIVAPDGDGFFALVSEGGDPDNSGPFTNFGGYSSEFVDHSLTDLRVYIDTDWAENEGFQYSVAANGSDGLHQHDFGFRVRSTGEGVIQIGGGSGSEFDPITTDIPNAALVSTSGWYTLQQVFNNVGGQLSVDMNLVSADGTVTHVATITAPQDTIGPDGEVGGNRYGWFTDISIGGGLAIDAVHLGDFEGRVIEPVTGSVQTSGVIPFADVDVSETHTVSAVANQSNYLGTFTPTLTADSTGDGHGSVSWTFNATASQLAQLAGGQTVTQNYTVTLLDSDGLSSSQVVSVTLVGTEPLILSNGTFATYNDTAASDTSFAVAEGQIDNNPGPVAGVGNLQDPTPGTYSYALTGAGVSTIPGGTIINTTYGQLIVATDGRYQFTPNAAAINALPPGPQTLSFTVQVTDSDIYSTPGSGTFTVTINGASDAVQLTGGVLATYTDTGANDDFAVIGGRIDNNSTATMNGAGQLTGDSGSTYTYALTDEGASTVIVNGQPAGTELNGEYGKLVLANDGRYQFVPDDAAINALPAGTNPTLSYTIQVTDSNGSTSSSTFTVNLNGASENQVSLEGGSLGSVSEGGSYDPVQGQIDDTPAPGATGDDVGDLTGGTGDVTYALTGAGVQTIEGGTLINTAYGQLIVAADGRYQFAPDAAAIEALPGTGEDPVVLEFTVAVTDDNGTTTNATFTVEVNGEDDAVGLVGGELGAYEDTGADDDFVVIEGTIDTNPGAASNGVGQLTGDTGNERTYTLNAEDVESLYDGETLIGTRVTNQYGSLIVATDGRYQFVPNDAAINSLTEGQNASIEFSVNVHDENGSNAQATFTVALTGAADDAISLTGGSLGSYVDTPGNDEFNVLEGRIDNSPLPNNDGEVGTLSADQDLSYTYALTGAGVETIEGGTLVHTAYGQLIVAEDGRYQFTPDQDAIQALAPGETTLSFDVQVTGSNDATDTATFTIDLTGSNEMPYVSEGDYYELTETNAALTVTGQIDAEDPSGSALTYSYGGDDAGPSDTFKSFCGDDDGFNFNYEGNSLTEEQYDTLYAAAESAFTIDPVTGAYSFNLASPDFLDPNETLYLEYRVDVTNALGETSYTWVNIDIDGTIEAGPAGTASDDDLTGSAFGDAINSGGGDDLIHGLGGDDVINSGSGDDEVWGGDGDDTLRGASGDDVLHGGSGYNNVDGGSGTDTLVLEGNPDDYYYSASTSTSGTFYNEWGNENEATQFVNIENFQFADGTVMTMEQVNNGWWWP